MEDIVISYETLFELLRIERSRTELQKLPSSYINDVKQLIGSIISDSGTLDDGRKKNEIYLKNMLKIVSELYERREKKIINMALDKSKTKSAIIDFSKFLDYEKELFYEVMGILDKYRDDLNKNILSSGEIKETQNSEKGSESKGIMHDKEMVSGTCERDDSVVQDNLVAVQKNDESHQVVREEPKDLDRSRKTVRFLSLIPRFLGPELEEYGPFDEEDIADLPSRIVDILVKKNRAEEIALNT